jgi:hypothetical protein
MGRQAWEGKGMVRLGGLNRECCKCRVCSAEMIRMGSEGIAFRARWGIVDEIHDGQNHLLNLVGKFHGRGRRASI